MPEIKNQLVVNPETERPYVFRDQKIDNNGETMWRNEVRGEGERIMTIRVPDFEEPKHVTLFEVMIRCLRDIGAADLTCGAVEHYFHLASAIRRARQAQPMINEQRITVPPTRFAWLKTEMKTRLHGFSQSREFIATVLQALGMLDEGQQEAK